MNRFNKGNIHTFKLMLAGLLLTLAMLFIIACPNPNMHVWFVRGNKLVKELKFGLHDDKMMVKLSSFSALGSESDKYSLRIGVDIKFQAEIKYNLKFVPESAKVYFGKHLMNIDSITFTPYEDTLSKNKYAVVLNYDYDMQIDSSIVASVYERKGVNLRIIMDNFIYYKGEPLHIDTILAVEKQQFLY